MTGKIILLLCCALFTFAPVVNGNDDHKHLEGTWVLETGELGGNPLPDDFKGLKLEMTNGRYTVQNDHGTYALLSDHKPQAMDITGTEGPNKGRTFLAIYELDGETLKICYDLGGKDRPTEFRTRPGSLQFLAVYHRMKREGTRR